MEEALQKADVYYDEYEPYQKNIDNLLVDMENDQMCIRDRVKRSRSKFFEKKVVTEKRR